MIQNLPIISQSDVRCAVNLDRNQLDQFFYLCEKFEEIWAIKGVLPNNGVKIPAFRDVVSLRQGDPLRRRKGHFRKHTIFSQNFTGFRMVPGGILLLCSWYNPALELQLR